MSLVPFNASNALRLGTTGAGNAVAASDNERIQSEAFEAYVEAKRRVEETASLADGIAAGLAFRRFLDVFLTPNQARALGDGHSIPSGQVR